MSYTPPPGWYVRSHSVECPVKYGHSSFSINTVPQDWQWSSEEKIQEAYQYLIELAGQAHHAAMQARFAHERDQLLRELHKVRSSHHALVVDATAKGEGFWRGGGGLQLTVMAELVYIGTDDQLSRAIAQQRVRLVAPGTGGR